MQARQIKLVFRIVGLLVFLSAAIAVSSQLEQFPAIPESIHLYAMIISGIIGAVIGWIYTPRLVIKPFNRLRRSVQQVPAYVIAAATFGLFVGLALGAIASYPISLLPHPLGQFLPFISAAAFGYAGLSIAVMRPDLFQSLRTRLLSKDSAEGSEDVPVSSRASAILLDTSVIIDGRIADVCRTGFIQGELVVPLFVLNELQHVADSADTLRRNRGRRGLEILRQLQEESPVPVRLVDEDMPSVREVDDKLIALAKEMNEVSVGGGAVTVVISGHQRVQSITINKDAIDLEDEEWLTDLQDLVVLAMNQAIEQSQTMAAERMESITGGLGGMPGLGGLLG